VATGWEDLGVISSTNILDPNDLRENNERLQKGLNGGLSLTDFETREEAEAAGRVFDPITTDKIKKPEFYGSPSPRVESVISDIHYRYRTNSKLDRYYRHEHQGFTDRFEDRTDINSYQPIEGLSSVVICRETPLMVVISGSFYANAKEGRGGTEESILNNKNQFPYFDSGVQVRMSESGYFKATANQFGIGECHLFVDNFSSDPITGDGGPSIVPATQTLIFCQGLAPGYNSNGQQYSFHKILRNTDTNKLTKGRNVVSYRCRYRRSSAETNKMRHLYFDARNFVVDVYYK
tara:strand:- start:321 stop:1196 length:876 start_codon:yes stop_codon:yes gene_type:complete